MASSLLQFVAQVPRCYQYTRLAAVLSIFMEGGHEQVVVLDEHERPVGVLSLVKLMPYLVSSTALNEQNANPEVKEKAGNSPTLALLRERLALQEPIINFSSSLLESVVALPSSITIEQLWHSLQPSADDRSQHYYWVLTDADQKYLGLLDSSQVLKYLAAGSTPASPQLPRPDWQLQTGSWGANAGQGWMSSTLEPLLDLLELLPVSLMLQTSTGRMLSQNQTWRTQVAELQNPGWISQTVAAFLESPGLASTHGESGLPSDVRRAEAWPLNPDQGEAIAPSVCQLGSDGNTCICTCVMKDGQRRVWQFVKMPLDQVMASLNQGMAAHRSKPQSSPLCIDNFHLANLETAMSCALASSNRTARSGVPAPQPETLWLILAQDLTSQQQLTKELAARNADLRQLNQLKDEFLACLGHELKNPLTSLLGLSKLLKDERLGELNQRQSRYAHLMYQSGRHLMSLLNNILELAHIETGQLELKPAWVPLKAVCQRALKQAHQSLQPLKTSPDLPSSELPDDVSARFTASIEPGLDRIWADELRLCQVLSSLLSNALKFTPSGDALGLTVKSWDNWIAFTVWDKGIGIAADKQYLIFQKFQQIEHSLADQFDGTGLGLVLAQHLARLHGGEITFTSREGVGSEFTLLMPARSTQTPLASGLESLAAKALSLSRPNRLILVVQVNPRVIDALVEPLTDLGYRVAIARSGTEAIEKVRRLQPGAVLLDPAIPLLSGWDVLTLLKSDTETQHIPTIMTAAPALRAQAYRAQVDGFLNLPIDGDALQKTLARVVKASEMPPAESPTLSGLTVLHLGTIAGQSSASPTEPNALAAELNRLLHTYQCRVLEVEDLDQAEMLARVWQPDVILLDPSIPDPASFLAPLSSQLALASLPLVTLTREATQVANQIPDALVFPYLAPLETQSYPTIESSALLQVIQVAAGIT
ncbi:MAG: response regulator [Cyanothece sp. SIO1E1]|nr:response regulator [Cyanothece sp. SIO1E1]